MATKNKENKSSDNSLLDPNIPMHHQIYIQLRMEILDGMWVGRANFPGEEELAAQYNVSKITSRKALESLVADNLIRRERGRRSSVIFDPSKTNTLNPAPAVFPLGSNQFDYSMLSIDTTIAPAGACDAFGLPPGSHLWTCSRLRSFQNRAHSVSISIQPPEQGALHSVEDLESTSMPVLMERAGIKSTRLHRRLSVSLPSLEVARHLGISIQQSVLVYTYRLFDDNQNTVEWVRNYVHPREPAPVERINLVNDTWEVLDIL